MKSVTHFVKHFLLSAFYLCTTINVLRKDNLYIPGIPFIFIRSLIWNGNSFKVVFERAALMFKYLQTGVVKGKPETVSWSLCVPQQFLSGEFRALAVCMTWKRHMNSAYTFHTSNQLLWDHHLSNLESLRRFLWQMTQMPFFWYNCATQNTSFIKKQSFRGCFKKQTNKNIQLHFGLIHLLCKSSYFYAAGQEFQHIIYAQKSGTRHYL